MTALSPGLLTLSWLLVPVFGGLGAYGRFRTEAAIVKFFERVGILHELADDAPVVQHTARAWPILIVNIIGCFIAGLLTGNVLTNAFWALPIGTGLMGGWTTFSTAMMDAYSIARRPERHPLVTRLTATVITAFVTLIVCVIAAVAGIAIGRSL